LWWGGGGGGMLRGERGDGEVTARLLEEPPRPRANACKAAAVMVNVTQTQGEKINAPVSPKEEGLKGDPPQR